MSKDSPHTTPSLPTNAHLEDEYEDHQHHAGCQHGKQILPANNKFKIGRNDSCFCGSGKKYKKCCLSLQ